MSRDDEAILLIVLEPLGGMAPALAGPWRVEKLWEHADREAFFSRHGAQVRCIVTGGEVPLPTELLEALPNLGLIASIGAGYNGFDLDWCRAHGVAVTNTPAVNAEDVADHAVAQALCAWRLVLKGDQIVRHGGWTEASRGLPLRPSLRDKRVGVVGLGHIGEAIARRMEAFGTQVAWWGPRPKPNAPWPRVDSVLDLAKASDLLFIAVRAMPDTHHLVDKAVIEALGPDGLLCNVARGFVVDQQAMIAALQDGRLGMAALDVFDPEPTPTALWRDMPNTVLTPHVAGSTVEGIPHMRAILIDNIKAFFAGQPLPSLVPELA